jgi:hypothetical protein
MRVIFFRYLIIVGVCGRKDLYRKKERDIIIDDNIWMMKSGNVCMRESWEVIVSSNEIRAMNSTFFLFIELN